MNFDKFKGVKPSAKITENVLDKISDKDEKYIEKLAEIQYKKSNKRKIIHIVSEAAAAVLLVTAFSLWALLGLGIRGTYNPPADSPDGDIDSEMSVYKITVTFEGELREGREELQRFFDDCVGEKACTIEVTHLDKGEDSYYGLPDGAVPPLYTTTLIYRKNGAVTVKFDQPDSAYSVIDFAFNNRDFVNMKFVFNRFENKFAVQYLTEGTDRSYSSFLPLDEIENKYENSKRVFDTAKTESVKIENGNVISGESTLAYFFRSLIDRSYAAAQINGMLYTSDRDKADSMTISENGVETEFSKSNKISDISFAFDSDVSACIWTGFVCENGSKHTMAEISLSEFSRLGLLYSTRGAKLFAGDSDKTGTEIKNSDELVLALLEDMPLETKTALMVSPVCYIKLNDYVTIYLYKNETNDSLNDTFGISYFEGDSIHSMGNGDKLLSIVKELIGVIE